MFYSRLHNLFPCVPNNHLKFIQLITNWQAEGRLAWRLFRPLATRSRDLCGLHSERQSGIIINFSNNLLLFKYYNIYIYSSTLSLYSLGFIVSIWLVFFPRHYNVKANIQFSNLNKIRLQLPLFAEATVKQQSWTNNHGSFVVFYEGKGEGSNFFGK